MKAGSTGIAIAMGARASVPELACAAGVFASRSATVNREAALRAARIEVAQIEITRIEKTLPAAGLLDGQHVNGHCGTELVRFHSRYQKSPDSEEIGANGPPGAGSLRRMGTDRFELTRVLRSSERGEDAGEVVNAPWPRR